MNNHNSNARVRVYYCRNAAHGNGTLTAITNPNLKGIVTLEAVPCSGRIDPRYLLKAFESGADAVCILACPSGDCKLMEGNLRATRRIHAVRELLAEAGLDPDAAQIFLPSDSTDKSRHEAIQSVAKFVSREPEEARGMVTV